MYPKYTKNRGRNMAISKYRCTEKWKLVKHRVCEQHWWVKRVKKLKAITLDTCSWTDTKCENKESTCHAYRSVFDKYEVELDTSSVTRGRAWSKQYSRCSEPKWVFYWSIYQSIIQLRWHLICRDWSDTNSFVHVKTKYGSPIKHVSRCEFNQTDCALSE